LITKFTPRNTRSDYALCQLQENNKNNMLNTTGGDSTHKGSGKNGQVPVRIRSNSIIVHRLYYFALAFNNMYNINSEQFVKQS